MKAVGIDLGTTNSLVAVVEQGQARTLADEDGRALLPSVVRFFDDGRIVVGEDAKAAAVHDPKNTVSSIKRLLGRTAAEANQNSLHNYDVQQDGAVLRIQAGNRTLTAVEVSAEILKVLADRAKSALQSDVSKVVITVPAYFDDTQRQATRQAGRLAGLEVMRLLNEPTAAALAYGLEKKKQGVFAVFDLGGGTFDISILRLEEGVFEVMSTGGNSQLGGDDFDVVVAAHLLKRAGIEAESASPEIRQRALQAAENGKKALSETFETVFEFETETGGIARIALTRDEYTQLILPVLQGVIAPCKQALSDAEIRVDQLDGVVLVGGSTRSPIVAEFVADLFEQKPLGDIDPDEVVALGAASQADLLSAESELRLLDGGDVLLLDVTPLSLGLETMGGLVEVIIPRCSQIPASRAQEFTTYQDGQTAMDIHVLQGERDLVKNCRSLARFQVQGIPPTAAGVARVRINFQIDADGILKVSAHELSTGVGQTIEVQPTHGLDDETVEHMLQAALDHAEEDVMNRQLKSAQVEGQRVLNALKSALHTDGDLLESDEKTSLESVVNDLEDSLGGTDPAAIQDLTELLDKLSAGLAERRMNRALNEGLKDMDVSALEAKITDKNDASGS
ncbi:MAG: Fe-S protein assembly chaperone HscA [Myxococcota bacterium]|nr:Fe-S protein assembly chaperone HscA [Myxococcota bacterium]